jgi:peptidoglycan/xylan/chitin deacetylase (PgdA/CDA1 family)
MLPAFGMHLISAEGHIACFVYHRIGDKRYPSTNISVSEFRGQLAYLKQNNFTVWTMGKAVKAIMNGEYIPSKTVVLTIDDGYHSFYENGLPLLEEFGYPATLYINTANVGQRDYLSWEEIKDADKRGMEIGNHSHEHSHFLNYENPEVRKAQFFTDLNMSQTIFFDKLGYSPDLYSYPYGEYDDVMKEVLAMAGFIAASAQFSGILHRKSNLFEIPRFPMGGPFATLKGFIQKSQMKPILVISKTPGNIVMEKNPPSMEIILDGNSINPEFIQCFVNGERNCITEMQEGPDYVKMKITSRNHLRGRRSLYTITAPARNGKGWCWYSHVWVNTAIPEE